MRTIEISKSETGVIRLFAISRPIATMARSLKQYPKAQVATELLSHPVTDDDIELFPLSDLHGVGLPRYLTDGYDIDHGAVNADRSRLDGLDGYVLLLFSRVSQAGDVMLRPSADLTLIATYSEPKRDRATAPIAAKAAAPYSGTMQTPKASARSRVGSIFTAITVLIVLGFIWWILR